MYRVTVLALLLFVISCFAGGLDDYEGHNIIDATPECYNKFSIRGDGRRLCPFGAPGARFSIFPNEVEKAAYITRNIARQFPEEYRVSRWGRKGGNTGNPINYACTATPREIPYYWNSAANQAARFHQWAYLKENCPNYPVGEKWSGHLTCPDWCDMFSFDPEYKCGYTYRTDGFLGKYTTNGVTGSEGLWTANYGFESGGHCGPTFMGIDPKSNHWKYRYAGMGYFPGTGMTNVWIRRYYLGNYYAPKPIYPLVLGTHINELSRVHPDDRDPTDNLVFMLEWSGIEIGKKTVKEAWLFYDDTQIELEMEFGDPTKSANANTPYNVIYNAFFSINVPIPKRNESCMPYAFAVIDSDDKIWRLPQNNRYFYGTYQSPSGSNLDELSVCEENHYYLTDAGTWEVNSSPEIELDNVKTMDGEPCQGCSKVEALATLYSNWAGLTPQPTSPPTLPSLSPLPPLSPLPSVSPTPAPVDPLCGSEHALMCVEIKGLHRGNGIFGDVTYITDDYRFLNGFWEAHGDHCVNDMPYFVNANAPGYFLFWRQSRWHIGTRPGYDDYNIVRNPARYHNLGWISNRVWQYYIKDVKDWVNEDDNNATVIRTATQKNDPLTCPVWDTFEDDPDCISIANINSEIRGGLNNFYGFTGQIINGRRSYARKSGTTVSTQPGLLLHFHYDPDIFEDSFGWIMVDKSLRYPGYLLYCDQNDFLQCGAELWVLYEKFLQPEAITWHNKTTASIRSCLNGGKGGVRARFEMEDAQCDTDHTHLCMTTNEPTQNSNTDQRVWQGSSATFIANDMCMNNRPVYEYTHKESGELYYIHYYDANNVNISIVDENPDIAQSKWVVSKHHSDGYLMTVAICTQDDVVKCTEGTWQLWTAYGAEYNAEEVKINYELNSVMSVDSCVPDKEEEKAENELQNEMAMMILFVLLGIVFCLCIAGCVWYKIYGSRKRKVVAIVEMEVNEYSDEENAGATNETNDVR